MAYRDPDQERTVEALREEAEAAQAARAAEMLPIQQRWGIVAAEISRLDHVLGEWSASVPDGTPAPEHALRLMDAKARLEMELRALALRLMAYAPNEAMHVATPPGLVRQLLNWLRRW